MPRPVSYGTNPSDVETRLVNSSSTNTPFSAIEVEVGRLDVAVHSLKERMEGEIKTLTEKLEGHRSNRRWVVATSITVIGGLIGGATLFYNLLRDSSESYRTLQKDYYVELVNMQKMYNSKTVLDIFKDCIKNGGWNTCLNQ
jgi:hypothetical protein